MNPTAAAAQPLDALRQVLDHCFEAVICVAPGGSVVFFNAAAERLFGYAAAEVLGRSLDLLVPVGYRGQHERFVRAFEEAAEDSRMMGRRGEIKARRKDGGEFLAEGTISKATIEGRRVYAAVLRDASERIANERRLQASEEKFRAIVDNAPDAIVVADAQSGVIREVNRAAVELFGWPPEALVGKHFEELHPARDRAEYREYFRQHLEAGRVRVPNAVIARADGSELPVAITAAPTEIAGERVLVGFFRDISDRRRWERELAQARDDAQAASRAKSDFLASMSHELRSPLNGIIGFAEMIRDQHVGPVGQQRYVEYAGLIHSSGGYLLQTIEEILDYSRLEAGKFQLHEARFAPADAVRECVQMLSYSAETAQLHLETRGLERLPELQADPHAFKQVLMNLLSNAIKFTKAGGRITVSGAPAADGDLAIAVEDSGIGIPAAFREHVFERFEQGENALLASRKGTGIGLPLARALMELHGGSLTLESEEGVGTRVTARFPASRTAAGEPVRAG